MNKYLRKSLFILMLAGATLGSTTANAFWWPFGNGWGGGPWGGYPYYGGYPHYGYGGYPYYGGYPHYGYGGYPYYGGYPHYGYGAPFYGYPSQYAYPNTAPAQAQSTEKEK